VTIEQRQAALARWGLNKPLIPDQLEAYVGATLQGDLGYSMKFQGQAVTQVIGDRFGPTILLIGLAELIAIFVGLGLGAYTGWRRGGLADRIGNGLSLILYSMPYFVIGMPMIIIFAAGLGWFPTSGMLTAGATYAGPVDFLRDLVAHLALPLATISLGLIGGYSILMRSSITETRAEDYIATARAKGLPDGKILRSHAIPNALLPAVTLVAINLGYVVGGAITAEIVFNWPGLGTLTVDALNSRDYPVLQGIFLLLGISVVLANFIADIVYGYLDPRVRQ
jgi:peptide/nickel transport system permease protein